MCGRKYVPLSELAQQPEEISLIPMRGVQSGGMYGGKYFDIFFTNKRIVVLSVFIGTWKTAIVSNGFDPSGMQGWGNLQGNIGAGEKQARENYENIGWDQALQNDPEHSYQVPYEELQLIKVSGRFHHTMEISSLNRNQKFGLDPVDFYSLLGALPQIPALQGKLELSE